MFQIVMFLISLFFYGIIDQSLEQGGTFAMAVKHLNQKAKEESGVVLSGEDARKVFAMFSTTHDSKRIEHKQNRLRKRFSQALRHVTSSH